MSNIQLKRIYEPYENTDGKRILVDRIWPRGVSKEEAKLTLWMKGIAPSTELRTWFGHQQDRFEQFKIRYEFELADAAARPYLDQLQEWAKNERVTLLFAAKDEQCNHAVVLKQYLEQ